MGTAGGTAPGGQRGRLGGLVAKGLPDGLPEAGSAAVEHGDELALGPDPGLSLAEVLDDQIDVRLLLAGPPQHLLDECDVLARLPEDRCLALVALRSSMSPASALNRLAFDTVGDLLHRVDVAGLGGQRVVDELVGQSLDRLDVVLIGALQRGQGPE